MYIVILICFFLLLYFSNSIKKDKISFSIISIYLIWFFFWLEISAFNPYGLYEVSDITYVMQLSGVVFFTLGFLSCSGLPEGSNKLISINNFNLHISRKHLLNVVLILFNVVLLNLYFKYGAIIASSGGAEARMSRFEVGSLFSSSIEILLYDIVLAPFVYVCMVVVTIALFDNKIKTLSFFLSIIYIFLFTSIGSGRGNVIELLMCILIFYFIRKAYLVQRQTNVLSGKKKKGFYFIIIVIVFATLFFVSYTTAVRMELDGINYYNLNIGFNAFFEQSVLYMTGPFRAFDYALKNNYIDITGYLYGRGTFAGFDDAVGMLINTPGIAHYKTANGIIGELLQNNLIVIGDEVVLNYAYTHLMIFYFDFGYPGIIIFSFLYGFLIRKAIIHFQKRPSFSSLLIVIFLSVTLLGSLFKWGLQSLSAVILLITAYYFSSRSFKIISKT